MLCRRFLPVHVGNIKKFPVPRAGLFSVKIEKKFLAINPNSLSIVTEQ